MDSSYVNAELNQLAGQVERVRETVEMVTKEVSILKGEIATIKRSEVIKKINDSEPVGMDCKTTICLGGVVTAESLVKHTTDSIQVTSNQQKQF